MFTHSLTITGCRPFEPEPEHITAVMPHVIGEATGTAEVIAQLCFMAARDIAPYDYEHFAPVVKSLSLHESLTFPSCYNGTVTVTRFAQSAQELTDGIGDRVAEIELPPAPSPAPPPRTDNVEFYRGLEAKEQGFKISDNPYPPSADPDSRYARWLAGWYSISTKGREPDDFGYPGLNPFNQSC